MTLKLKQAGILLAGLFLVEEAWGYGNCRLTLTGGDACKDIEATFIAAVDGASCGGLGCTFTWTGAVATSSPSQATNTWHVVAPKR